MSQLENQGVRLRRLFLEGFSVMDIAEPLVSFDADADARTVRQLMVEQDFDLVGIRVNGLVAGYVRRENLSTGTCRPHLQPFTREDDLVADTATLIEAVNSLAINERCFVTILERVGAILTLSDLEKPPMRMFLFGMITLSEMLMTDIIRHRYRDGSWQSFLSERRLEKTRELHAERTRRGQKVDLVDCLQYGDKGWILSYDEEVRVALGHASRREARISVKELEQLRNNLAHTQEIIPTGWRRIIILCSRLDQSMATLLDQMSGLARPPSGSAQKIPSDESTDAQQER